MIRTAGRWVMRIAFELTVLTVQAALWFLVIVAVIIIASGGSR